MFIRNIHDFLLVYIVALQTQMWLIIFVMVTGGYMLFSL